MATKVMSDIYQRKFDRESPMFSEEALEYNLFYLHARKKEITMSIKARKYETLNNVCRMLGVREFVDGNYIGWIDNEPTPFHVEPVDKDDMCTDINIIFDDLVFLNMNEILGE